VLTKATVRESIEGQKDQYLSIDLIREALQEKMQNIAKSLQSDLPTSMARSSFQFKLQVQLKRQSDEVELGV
jgi:hypothetical protein